ncbi:MAG: sulfotransferase [Actinomycetota bacterium]
MSEQTIFCILGMHRSGTSLVAHVLHALGLDLGPEEHLMRPGPANPAGHWENEPINEINDEILSHLGGTWSQPPELPAGWERSGDLDQLRRQAREVVEADFGDSDRWGFKDPRNCLTLPFWQRLLPPMRYVFCLRNPVDVAFSLNAREEEPLPFEEGVELWLTYMRAGLAATAAHPLQIVFYEDLMIDPEPAVRELAGFVGIDRSDEGEAFIRAAIRLAVSEGLWHHRTAAPNVVDEPRLPFHVKSLYLALRLFAPGAESVGIEAVDLLGAYAVASERERADLERRLAARRADLDRVSKDRAREDRLRKRLELELEVTRGELHDQEQRLREEFETQLEATREELRRVEAAASEAPAAADEEPEKTGAARAYDQLVDEVRVRARELIPKGSTVLVASKGDDELLELDGRRAMHFPVAVDGGYLGWHPVGDTAVIAQLEALRASGADHLLLPATTMWWLDHYNGLRRHMEDRYEELHRDERCVIYGLRTEGRRDPSGPIAALKRAVSSLRLRSGRDPSVLDWHTRIGVADQVPEMPVFVPPDETEALPYLDRSVDIVVVASADAARLAEARRVAASAVIRIDPSFPEAAELEWLSGAPSGWGEDVGVSLIADAGRSQWDVTLGALAESLDDGFAGELSVIADAATLEAASERSAAAGVQVRQIEAAAGASLAQRARLATEASANKFQVFVTAPGLALPDWLPSILTLFARNQDAGVVGTRILSPFGDLEEAGGVLAADGSRRRRGEGDQNPDRPEYCFVQRVDFCSAPMLATTREVFERLGGFGDGGVAPGDALVDFSLRAGKAGASVYYQPKARVVRIGEADR